MEDLVVFIFVVFGTSLGGLILWKLFDITRNSINKNKKKYDEDKFERLAKAFIQHKKDTDRRLHNIEAILTGGNGEKLSHHSADKKSSRITIDEEPVREQESKTLNKQRIS